MRYDKIDIVGRDSVNGDLRSKSFLRQKFNIADQRGNVICVLRCVHTMQLSQIRARILKLARSKLVSVHNVTSCKFAL